MKSTEHHFVALDGDWFEKNRSNVELCSKYIEAAVCRLSDDLTPEVPYRVTAQTIPRTSDSGHFATWDISSERRMEAFR